jgi:4-hydroxymandelate oxidase
VGESQTSAHETREVSIDQIETFVNLHELEEAARTLIPALAFGYMAGGAEDEVTLHENRAAFGRWRLLPRVLRGVRQPDISTTVLGQSISLPVMLDPVGIQRLAHPEGELAAARAAQQAGTVYCLSTVATSSLEDVGAATDRWWFQLYFLKDRNLNRDLVKRAEEAGASALILTVDLSVLGRREADLRNGFALSIAAEFPTFAQEPYRGALLLLPDLRRAFTSEGLFEPALRWSDVDWLRAETSLPLILKGILSPADARLATEHGVQGIIVSTHGGRQLDSSVASLDALPAVVEAAGDGIEVFLDSGVRRGTDVLKALALGARAILIGRPYLWGLSVGGEAGVSRVLELLRAEIVSDMILCGLENLGEIDRRLVVPIGPLI